MTPQEMFDISATHLLKQNRPAIGTYGGCKYKTVRKEPIRDEDGKVVFKDGKMQTKEVFLQCAVGCFIPQERYVEEMEVRGLMWVLDRAFLLESGEEPDGWDVFCGLACSLQEVHDGHHQTKWKDLLKEVATRYGLEFNQ